MANLLKRFQRGRPSHSAERSAQANADVIAGMTEAAPTGAPLPAGQAEACRLRQFDPRLAGLLVPWVDSPQVLRWLAPSAVPPLTAETVRCWHRADGRSLCLVGSRSTRLMAYGELNPMRHQVEHYWLGHILVNPSQRGRGLGTRFVQAMETYAFDTMGALQLTLVVFPDNDAAVRCYRRAGFRDVGEEDHRFTSAGPSFRLLRMTLMRCEWTEGRARQSAPSFDSAASAR